MRNTEYPFKNTDYLVTSVLATSRFFYTLVKQEGGRFSTQY